MDKRPAVAWAVGACAILLLAGAATAVRSAVETDCPVPSTVGLPLAMARSALLDSGVDEGELTTVRVADEAAESTIVRQRSTSCSEPVDLVVSDGGPVVSAADVPAPLRSLLGGVADASLVRKISTAQGEAYKTDSSLAGDCAATRIASVGLADDDFAVHCRPPLERRLSETVLAAMSRWLGEPPSGGRGLRSGIADGYMGTAWGARASLDGWQLQVDVTISASREAGSPGPRRTPDSPYTDEDAASIGEAELIVSMASGTTSVDVLLVPDGEPSGAVPPTLTQLRELADDLIDIASRP